MIMQFKVNASPGVYKITTEPERRRLLRQAVTKAIRMGSALGEGATFHAHKKIQLTVNRVKNYILLVTQDEAEDWLPALC